MESVKIPFNVKVHEILERFEGAKSVGEKLEIYSQLKGDVAALKQVLKLMRRDWVTPPAIAPRPDASGPLIKLLATAPRHEFEEVVKSLASAPAEKPLIHFIESQEKKASEPLSETAPILSEAAPASSGAVRSCVACEGSVWPIAAGRYPEAPPVLPETPPVLPETPPVLPETPPVLPEAPLLDLAEACVACEGAGKSSSGKQCRACSGTGKRKEKETSVPTDAAVSPEAAQPEEKAKRRGRPRKEVKAPEDLPATHLTPEVVFVQDPLDDVSLIEKHRHGIDFLDMIGTWDKVALMTAYKKHVGKAATADMSMSLLAASILEAKEKVRRVTSAPECVTSAPERVTTVPESVTTAPESVTGPSTPDPVDLPTDPPKKQPTRRRIGKLNGKKESAPKVSSDSEIEPEVDKEAVKAIAIPDSAAAVAPKVGRVPNLLDQVALNQKATAMVDELFKGMQLEVDEDMFRREMMAEMASWDQERVVKEWEKSTGAKFTPAVTRNQMLLEIVETLAK